VANLPLRPLVAKVFSGFPATSERSGQDSIVGQSFILLNAKTHFFGLAARSICGTNVHLANLEKAIY
jgi:predicted transcriptional regulator of viral defense system